MSTDIPKWLAKIALLLSFFISPVINAFDVQDPNHFLKLFNNISPAFEESESTANAYLKAIDPFDRRTNLDDFLDVNQYSQVDAKASAIYLNDMDLGFGRDMHVWEYDEPIVGTFFTFNIYRIASFVKNYGDSIPGDTVAESVDGDPQDILHNVITDHHLLATVAMEYAPPDKTPLAKNYTRFYAFDKDGKRINKVDLDGRGIKYLPGACNVCHGGNPRPLNDKGEYPQYGDTDASFLPWDLDNLVFSEQPSYSRGSQEEQLRLLNEFVLRTGPNDAVRHLIKGWYKDGFLSDNFLPSFKRFEGSYRPTGWASETLYSDVIAPYCRACHIVRNPALDFNEKTDVTELQDRIEDLVNNRRMMPLAKRTFERFWSSNAPEILLSSPNTDDRPPIAEAGISFNAPTGTKIPLDGTNTLFSDYPNNIIEKYIWNAIGYPAFPNIEGDHTPTPVFDDFSIGGLYTFKIDVSNEFGVDFDKVEVYTSQYGDSARNPNTPQFNDIYSIYTNKCESCHAWAANNAPAFDEQRLTEEMPEAVYRNLSRRVNVQDPENSLLLIKNDGVLNHSGGALLRVGTNDYNVIKRWIEFGALYKYRPINDNIRNALELEGISGTVYGTTFNATIETSSDELNKIVAEPTHTDDSSGSSVWWKWRAPASGDLVISFPENTFSMSNELAVYAGKADVAKIEKLAASNSFHDSIELPVRAGEEYLIAVDTLNFDVAISVPDIYNIQFDWEFTRNFNCPSSNTVKLFANFDIYIPALSFDIHSFWTEFEFYGEIPEHNFLWKLKYFGSNKGCRVEESSVTYDQDFNIHINSIDVETVSGFLSIWVDFEFSHEKNNEYFWRLKEYGFNK